MEKNTTGKYAKYALGEIILVVIGILIAIQINNWNEDKAAQIRIDSRLISLAQDIDSDIAEMDEILEAAQVRLTIVKSILEESNRLGSFGVLQEPSFEPTTPDYENPNSKLSFLRTIDGKGPTYNELLNSGEFYLIRNEQLADKIQAYYFNVAQTKDRENANNKASNVRINMSKNRLGLGTHSQEGTLDVLIELAISDNQFGAELEHRYIMDISQYNNTSELKIQAQELIEAIESINN